jgi:hypothetical protein
LVSSFLSLVARNKFDAFKPLCCNLLQVYPQPFFVIHPKIF